MNSTLTLNIVAMSSQVTKEHNHTYQEHTPEFECRGTPDWSEFPSRSTNNRINDLEYIIYYKEQPKMCIYCSKAPICFYLWFMNGDVLFPQIFGRRNCPADPTKNFKFRVYLRIFINFWTNQIVLTKKKRKISLKIEIRNSLSDPVKPTFNHQIHWDFGG